MTHTSRRAKSGRATIAVVGLGYVGLPLAVLTRKKGYEVIGYDIDKRKVKLINAGIMPYADHEMEKRFAKTPIRATADAKDLERAGIIIICVPTPVHENHTPDLRPVISSAQTIAPHLSSGVLVIVESTVNPGICETVVAPILERMSGLTAGRDFSLAHCPERINPGDPKWDVENISRVVGATTPEGLRAAVDFYASILTGKVKPMGSLREAEAVKVVENAFRDVNIAFVNELARSFSYLGLDIVNVIKGAATKPFSFMPHFPGAGVGGHCIPVDPYYLIQYAKKNGFTHRFLSLARTINNEMPVYAADRALQLLREQGKKVRGANIAVLGLAYKANIDDCRESPSFKIISRLKRAGVRTIAYDPYVPNRSDVSSLDKALESTSVVVVATAHDVFVKTLTPKFLERYGVSVVLDGRNCLDKDAFTRSSVAYAGIGREAKRATAAAKPATRHRVKSEGRALAAIR